MVGEMALMSLFGLMDAYWIGRLGQEAMAAVFLGTTVVWVVTSMGNGLGVGGAAIVARRTGEGDQAGANSVALQAILLGTFVSLALGGMGFALRKSILELLRVEAEVMPYGMVYLGITFAGLFGQVLVMLINSLFRGVGSAFAAMGILACTTLVALVLEPLLIFGPGPFPAWGLGGAALAYFLSQLVGLLMQVFLLLGGWMGIDLRGQNLKVDPRVMGDIITIGLPAMFQMMLRSTSRLVVMRIVAIFGTAAIAGYGLANRLTLTVLIPVFGLANVVRTMVGQNLGTRNPERAERSVRLVWLCNSLIMGVVMVGFLVGAERVVGPLSGGADLATRETGAVALRIIALSYLFSALGITMGGAFGGAGDTIPPMVINAVTLWALQIPAAYGLSQLMGGASLGVWMGVALANAANGTLMYLWFRRGRWKRRKL